VELSTADAEKWGSLLGRAAEPSRPRASDEDYGDIHQIKQQQRRLKTAEVEAVIRRAQDGETQSDLARAFGVHRTTIAGILQVRGIVIEPHAIWQLEVDRAVRMYQSGQSLAAIGKELGYSANTIRTHLLQRGVALRPRSR
jgi:transposase-like protein